MMSSGTRSVTQREDYIFQLCSTYNWESLEEYCSFILNPLVKNILPCPSLLRDQLIFVDQWGNNCFHIALFHNAPLQVIQNLLHLSQYTHTPSSTGALSLSTRMTRDGSTPLLIAVGRDSDTSILRALLCSPTTPTCSSSTNSVCVIQPDNSGVMPIEELCNRFEQVYDEDDEEARLVLQEKIHLFLQVLSTFICTSTSNTSSVGGTCYTNSFMNTSENLEHENNENDDFYETLRYVLPRIPYAIPFHHLPLFSNHEHLQFPNYYDANTITTKNTVPDIPDEDTTTPHFSNSFIPYEPPLLPLHLAISTSITTHPTIPVSLTTIQQLDRLCYNQDCVIQMLIQQHPNSIQTPVHFSLIHNNTNDLIINATSKSPNMCWRTPFCQAISSGLWWHSLQKHYPDYRFTGPLQRIWKSQPQALESRDLITGLYPFMLAATVSIDCSFMISSQIQESQHQQQTNSDGDAHDESNRSFNHDMKHHIQNQNLLMSKISSMQLSTIYSLLRTHPQILDIVLRDNRK